MICAARVGNEIIVGIRVGNEIIVVDRPSQHEFAKEIDRDELLVMVEEAIKQAFKQGTEDFSRFNHKSK